MYMYMYMLRHLGGQLADIPIDIFGLAVPPLVPQPRPSLSVKIRFWGEPRRIVTHSGLGKTMLLGVMSSTRQRFIPLTVRDWL